MPKTTAWRNHETTLVEQYSINSAYFRKIGNVFRHGLAYPWPYRIVRIALAALFIYGGVSKLLAPKTFAATISSYDLAPEALLPLVATFFSNRKGE